MEEVLTRPPSSDSASEQGTALVITLLLTLTLSAIGASLIFLSQTETYASMNYRVMSQTRYAAEAGIQKAVNHLLNGYTLPGTAADPLANFDMTVSPVTYQGQPVVLSAMDSVAANYPAAGTRAGFHDASQGTLPVGGSSLRYSAYATLLSMRQVQAYGSTTFTVVQTWRITGSGALTGARPGTVEVSAILERQLIGTNTYGVFATDSNCGSLRLSGGTIIDSYDATSMTMSGGQPVVQQFGGDIGTNGNLTETGSNTTVYGSLSTPRTGVGNCSSGSVDALSGDPASIKGGIIHLSQAISFPPPDPPNPVPPTTNNNMSGTSSCAGAGFPAANCAGPAGNLVLHTTGSPLTLGNVKMTGGAMLHLTAGTYNLNSISLSGNSQVIIDSGPVILNVAGQGETTPIDFSGGTISNPSFVPTNFQILYAGTGGVKLSGGTASAALVYTPSAPVTMSGGSNFYGSVLGATMNNTGGTAIHYDRSLAHAFFTTGNFMLSSFTWKKY